MKASKTTRLEGRSHNIQLSSLPCWRSACQQVRPHTETRMGPFLHCLALQGFQVRQLCGREDHEELSTLPGGQLRRGTYLYNQDRLRYCKRWPATPSIRNGSSPLKNTNLTNRSSNETTPMSSTSSTPSSSKDHTAITSAWSSKYSESIFSKFSRDTTIKVFPLIW